MYFLVIFSQRADEGPEVDELRVRLQTLMREQSIRHLPRSCPIPDTSDDIVMLIIGSLTGIATAVISFYFGASNKDKK